MRRTLALTMVVLLLGGWFATNPSPSAMAQDQPENVDFVIRVLTCEPVSTPGPGTAAVDSFRCVRVDGVAISVATDTGHPIGDCITGQSRPGWGECVVQAPAGTDVVVTADVTTLPPGQAPRENPQLAFVYGGGIGGVDIVNLPADLADLPPMPPVGLVREHTASLTIHHRVCPVAYDGPGYYGECHDDPINGTPFLIEGLGYPHEVETLADGNVIVAGLLPGGYAVRGGPPGNLVRNAIFCAPASSPGTPYPFIQISNIELTLDLSAGQDVICDWYSVPHNLGTEAIPLPAWSPFPVNQTLTISGMICPVGYEGNDFVRDCSGTTAAGAFVRVEVPFTGAGLPTVGFATADANGAVTFVIDPFVPGPLRLHIIIPADVPITGGFTVPFVSCAAGGNDVLNVEYIQSRAVGQIVELAIEAGDDVSCHVYFLPLAPSG